MKTLALSRAEWRKSSYRSQAYREAIFGGGYGLLSFHVEDAIELIRIFDIAWNG